MPNTTRTQIAQEVNNFYDRTLLLRAVPLFLHTRWAQVRDIPANAGTNTIKFRRYSNLTAATTPLSEGITPTGSQLTTTDITASINQYGDFITITDIVSFETPDPVLMEASEIMGDQSGDTLDQVCRDILAAGTSAVYANSQTQTSGVAATNILTEADLKQCVLNLKNNKCRKMTTMIDPSTGYNTTPIPACYIAIIHPNITKTLKGFSTFTPVQKYPNQNGVMEGEVGSYDEIRFVETTNAKVKTGAGAAGIDVYCTLIFGSNAYGITRISGEALKNIVKPLGSGGTNDPLDQRATSGWKATFTARILNDAFMQRLECAMV